MTPKVSIIVPIHDAKEYLERCLDTLINQSLRNIEIILVLDCPSDGSDIIAYKYSKQDDRIKLIINNTNKHIGLSRNVGLDAATSDYIGFSDHDDFRDLNMYEKLYNRITETNSDIVLGISSTVGSENRVSNIPNDWDEKNIQELALEDLLRGGDDISNNPIFANIHPNLYKTSFLKKNNIYFVDTRRATPEDRIFQSICLLLAKKVDLLNEVLYYQVIHYYNTSLNPSYSNFHSRLNGKLFLYENLIKYNLYKKHEVHFLISVKKEFTNRLIESFLSSIDVFKFISQIRVIRSLPFGKIAYKNGHYSIGHCKLLTRLIHKVIWLAIRI